jgi:hypothetical protein
LAITGDNRASFAGISDIANGGGLPMEDAPARSGPLLQGAGCLAQQGAPLRIATGLRPRYRWGERAFGEEE